MIFRTYIFYLYEITLKTIHRFAIGQSAYLVVSQVDNIANIIKSIRSTLCCYDNRYHVRKGTHDPMPEDKPLIQKDVLLVLGKFQGDYIMHYSNHVKYSTT